MADSTETRSLLLQINATTELLRGQLSAAEQATAAFQSATQRHLDNVDKGYALLGKNLEGLEGPLQRLKGLGETAIGYLLGESLIETGKHALEFAGNVQFVSEQVGTSTKFLQQYRYAAGQFGVGTAEADEGLGKFSRSIGQAANGNKTLIELFDKLGVKVRDSGGNVRSVESAYLDTANAIAKLPDPAQKAADTMQLLGRQSIGLVPLLSSGAAGFNQLAQAAQALGVVLSPELIAHSEDVSHKLGALKQVVDAQMASAIAQNATSIEGLATSLIHLAEGLVKFGAAHPELLSVAAGAALGGKFGGLPGAIAGGIGSAAIYTVQNQDAQEQSTERPVLAKRYLDQLATYRQLKAQSDKGGGLLAAFSQDPNDNTSPVVTQSALSAAASELIKRYNAFTHAPKRAAGGDGLGSNRPGATNDSGKDLSDAQDRLGDLEAQKAHASGAALTAINDEIVAQKRKIGFIKQGADAELAGTLATKTGSIEKTGESAAARAARKAAEDHLKALGDDRAFQGELRTANEGLARARLQLADTAEGQLAVELQILRDASVTRDEQLKDQVASGKITQARADQLRGIYAETDADNAELARRKEQARLLGERVARDSTDLQGKIDLLGLQDRLATTAKQRLAVELQLLDYQEQLAKKAQQEIIDSPASTQAQRDLATQRIGQIDAQHPANVALLQQQNLSPSQEYLRTLNPTSDERGELFQSKEVEALQSFNQGLDDSIAKALHLHGIFGQIAEDIIDMAVKEALIKPLAGALFGGGSGGGFFGGLFGGGNSGVQSIVDSGVAGILGLAGGGSFIVGGNGGIDRNILSINGQPQVRVNQGETVAVIPRAPGTPSLRAIGQARAAAQPQVIYVAVDKAPLFDVHVQRATAPLAQAAMVGAVGVSHAEAAEQRFAQIP